MNIAVRLVSIAVLAALVGCGGSTGPRRPGSDGGTGPDTGPVAGCDDDTDSDMDGIADQLEASLANLQTLSDDLVAGRGTIGRLLRDDELSNEVDRAIGSIETIVGRPNRAVPECYDDDTCRDDFRNPIHLGEGGPALEATLSQPKGIALDDEGNLYIADTFNNRIAIVRK